MDPIHKFNGGIGATLCHNCGKMISEGMTEALYCLDCEVKVFKNSIDEWMKKPKNERDKDMELAKQEVLNEQRYKAYMEDKLNEFKYNLMAEAWREDEDEPKRTKEL